MEIWKDGFAVVQAQEHEVERRRDGRVIHGVKIDGVKDASQDVAQDWRSQRCFTRLEKHKSLFFLLLYLFNSTVELI
jgi:hypothetical protein